MRSLNIWDICTAIKGEFIRESLVKDHWVNGVSIDSRKLEKGQLFVPIVGERFDGHDFIESAYNLGVHMVLTSKKEKVPSNYSGIYVKDTKVALIRLARYYRDMFHIPIIGITGSVGKTSCKEMMASVLGAQLTVHKTQGNYNNDIGLPLTLLSMEEDTQVAILEMGMNHFGEIDLLSSIAKPKYAVITNIGVSHIENLGSKEGILKAKSEIVNHLDQEGLLLLNGDDPYLRRLEGQVTQRIIYFGFESSNEYYVKECSVAGFDGIKATIQGPKGSYSIKINALGKHMLYHALSAIIMGEQLGLNKDKIIQGIEAYKSEKMRLDKIEVNRGIIIINDSYNASVDSMKSALDVLDNVQVKGRRVAILGDMFELGDYAKTAHEEVGEHIVSTQVDLLICVGKDARYIYEKAYCENNNKHILYYKTQEELIQSIEGLLKDQDTILIKASRGMRLESTIEKIKEVS